MGSTLYDQIIAQRGSLENLMTRLPGFKGYHEKNVRRQADTILRQRLTSEIDQHIKRYGDLQNKLLDGGKGLRYMTRAREVKSRMQLYRDKVASATPKYSGMFEAIKITPEILERLYAFDEAQFRFLMQFESALDNLNEAIEAGEGIEDALDKVEAVASNAVEAFELRDNEILHISEDY